MSLQQAFRESDVHHGRRYVVLCLMVFMAFGASLFIASTAQAQQAEDELCSLLTRAKLQKDACGGLFYAQKAVQIYGDNACKGNAKKMAAEYDDACSNMPENKKRKNYEELTGSDLCALGLREKLKKNTCSAYDYYRLAMEVDGSNACGGKAKEGVSIWAKECGSGDDEIKIEASNVQKKSTSASQSEADLCSLGVREKLKKNNCDAYAYYRQAMMEYGPQACKGIAQEFVSSFGNACSYKNAEVDAMIPKKNKDSKKNSKKKDPDNSNALSIDDICSYAVRAKVKKDYCEIYHYGALAIEKAGINACRDKALEYIAYEVLCQEPQEKSKIIVEAEKDICVQAYRAYLQDDLCDAEKLYSTAMKERGDDACWKLADHHLKISKKQCSNSKISLANQFCTMAEDARKNNDICMAYDYYKKAKDNGIKNADCQYKAIVYLSTYAGQCQQ